MRSLLATTSKTSPSVPWSSVKPQARASSLDALVGRRPMLTFTSVMPAASRESRRFCACAPPNTHVRGDENAYRSAPDEGGAAAGGLLKDVSSLLTGFGCR